LLRLNYLDEERLARRIERMLKTGLRARKLLNLLLCAVVLAMGIAILLAAIRSWFTAF